MRLGRSTRVRTILGSKRIAFVIAVASITIIAVTYVSLPGASPKANAAAAHVVGCGTGVPLEKCNPVLDPSFNTPLPSSVPLPSTKAPAPSQATPCRSSFFAPGELSELTARFGDISCFELKSAGPWIIVGDGMTTNSPIRPLPPTRGGSIIAVDACSPANSSCLSPATPHAFNDFTVYYPPAPSTGDMSLMTTVGADLVNVADGSCGSFTFDTTTGKWYATSPANATSMQDGAFPTPVVVPAPVSGSVALTSAAPQGLSQSCSTK